MCSNIILGNIKTVGNENCFQHVLNILNMGSISFKKREMQIWWYGITIFQTQQMISGTSEL